MLPHPLGEMLVPVMFCDRMVGPGCFQHTRPHHAIGARNVERLYIPETPSLKP